MFLRTAAGLAPLLAAMAAVAFAQSPASTAAPGSPASTITVNAHLVTLPAIVRDKKGTLVQTLTKADFALAIDGHSQPIRYFDKDNDLPLTLGLLVDTSGSVRSALEDERSASEAFLDEMMTTPANRPPDQAFLIQFAHEAELLQELTSSRPRLHAALNQIGSTPADQRNDQTSGNNSGYGGYGRHGAGGRHFGGGTTLYDSVFLASDNIMKKQQGRKALVLLTDGEDRGSMETLATATASAQRAETVVYAIYFKGEQHGYGGHSGGFGGHGGYGGGQRGGENHVDGRKVLQQITAATGGRMFEVSGKQNFAAIYTQIAEELRSQYRLGYTPDATTAADGFHRIDLTVPNDKKLLVQTRNGYYGGQ